MTGMIFNNIFVGAGGAGAGFNAALGGGVMIKTGTQSAGKQKVGAGSS